MATKGSKRTAGKAVVKKGKPIQSRPAAQAAAHPSKVVSSAKAGATPKVRAATPSRASAGPSLIERAERLRDAIHDSKLRAADPWRYTAKARDWVQRAQRIVDEIARSGETAALRQKLDALGAEIEADRDYQEAHRRA